MAMLRVSDNTHKKVNSLANDNKQSVDISIEHLLELNRKYEEEKLEDYIAMSDEDKKREDARNASRNEFYLQRDLITFVGLYNDDRDFLSRQYTFDKFKGNYHDISDDRVKEIINTIIYPLMED